MQKLIEELLGRPFMAPDDGGAGGGAADYDAGGDEGEADAGDDEGGADEDASDEEGEDVDADGEDDDEEDFEFDGEKARLKKSLAAKLRNGVSMHADYTRKTQAHAAEVRAFQEEREAARKADAEINTKRGQIANVEEAIKKYEALDWNAIRAQGGDPSQAQFELGELRAFHAKLNKEVEAAEGAAATKQREARAKLVGDVVQTLNARVPGWSSADPSKPGIGAKVFDFAVREMGWTPQELFAMTDARTGLALYRAWRGSELEAAQKKAAKKTKQQTPTEPIKPVSKVGGRGRPVASSRPSDRDGVDAWMEKRNRQLRAS